MYMVILLFGFFGLAMGTGWVAQLLLGKSGRINWTQAFWVGLAGMGVAWLVGWLLDRSIGADVRDLRVPRRDRRRLRDPVDHRPARRPRHAWRNTITRRS